jgi:hypothetical protein
VADNIHVADSATITFAKACKAWLKHEEGRADSRNRNADLTKGSLAGKQGVAKNHLLPRFGNACNLQLLRHGPLAALQTTGNGHDGMALLNQLYFAIGTAVKLGSDS